jgi:hypothetical protein
MGFDLKLVNIDGPTCMAEALARIEDGLKDVDDSVVHNEDEESPGLLRLLRDYLAGVEPAWETAGALEIAFELGKAAAGGKLDAAALARLGGMARGAQRKAEADRVWRDDAKQIWRDTRGSRTGGDPLRKSQNIVADIICAEVPNAPDHDRVVKTLRAWDRGAS